MIENNKLRCLECGWRGKCEDVLVATNPFSPSESIYGCPRCKGIDRLDAVCDEPGCWAVASCGTPTKDEYRSTCGFHKPGKE